MRYYCVNAYAIGLRLHRSAVAIYCVAANDYYDADCGHTYYANTSR